MPSPAAPADYAERRICQFLRGTVHAEEEIRTVAIELWRIAAKECPSFFADFELRKENGIDVLWTPFPKV